jgi:translation initiation factor IF-1
MSKHDILIAEGTLTKALGHSYFETTLDNGIKIKAKQSHAYKRKLIVGDRIRVKISPYDITTGVIA